MSTIVTTLFTNTIIDTRVSIIQVIDNKDQLTYTTNQVVLVESRP